jgi:hypothetical protein
MNVIGKGIAIVAHCNSSIIQGTIAYALMIPPFKGQRSIIQGSIAYSLMIPPFKSF